MNFTVIENELIAARPVFEMLSPGPAAAFRGQAAKIAKVGFSTLAAVKMRKAFRNRESTSDFLADVIADRLVAKGGRVVLAKPRKVVLDAHMHVAHAVGKRDVFRKNGMGGRSWIIKPGKQDLVIIFHDANRAGPHIDIHIGRFSMIRRVKPEVYSRLKCNRDGLLTADSRDLLMQMLRDDIAINARIPQNLDHSKSNARASWTGGSREEVGYGAAITRQVVLEDKAMVYKAGVGHPIEFYAPAINPHRGMYIHQLYGGSDTRAPILVWGNLKPHPPVFHDRLHLRLTHPEMADTLVGRVDPATETAKYDGSSCYVVITRKGTTVWSPRISARTGEPIEYTFKIPGVASTYAGPLDGMDGTIVGMGELMFSRSGRYPWDRRQYLAQSEAGGLLNSNAVLPDDVRPEIRLYRVDGVGRNRVAGLPFFENRALQQQVAALNPGVLKVVKQMDYATAIARGFEGTVAVPEGGSVNDGFKIKAWMEDPHDWRIDEVAFREGDRGGVAGVVHLTSLDSGKRFKLGPGQIGNQELTRSMMANPHDYAGRVIKVRSRSGHEGRAAVMQEFHDAKGVW